MKYRDPLGVEIKVGQNVVFLQNGQIVIGDVHAIQSSGVIEVGKWIRIYKLDYTEIYVVGLDTV